MLRVATKELDEETGVGAVLLSEKIFSIQALAVDGHIKNGKYVSAHVHIDVCYLFEADENAKMRVKPDENKEVKWVAFEDADKDGIVDFIRPIHRKLIDKLRTFKK